MCSAAIYGGTLHLLEDLLAKFGVESTFVSLTQLAEPEGVIGDRTRLVWFESPINPTLRCVDVGRIAAACRARRVLSVIDNTFASPINQQPLALGVDLAMQSATKYLNGHSDVTGGVVSGRRELVDPIEKTRRQIGTVMDPYPAYALGRGLKTLPLRIARHNASARAIAEFLANDRRVSEVLYPGLPSHPDHAIARKQMTGFGGMVCFDLGGDYSTGRVPVRPIEDHQESGQSRRRREPDQHACADIALGTYGATAGRRRYHERDAAACRSGWRMSRI